MNRVPPHPRSRLSVLVGDDDGTIVEAVSDLVTGWGHRVYPAHGGREALSILLGHDIDVTILDVHMPDMTGLEIIEAYLGGPFIAAVDGVPRRAAPRPVRSIFMSGDADDDVRSRCASRGFCLLDKPFPADALRAAIDRILQPDGR